MQNYALIILDTNKENNANVQNLTGNVSHFNLPNEPCILESNQESNIHCLTNKVDVTNVSL